MLTPSDTIKSLIGSYVPRVHGVQIIASYDDGKCDFFVLKCLLFSSAIKRHVPAAWLPRKGGKNLVRSFDHFVPCSTYVERDTMFRKICLKHGKKVPELSVAKYY